MIKRVIKRILRVKNELHIVDNLNYELYQRYYSEESIKSRRFYNVGAGNFSHPYWTNIDYQSDWYKSNSELTAKGINYDLLSMASIPLEDENAEIIYSSHTIEHIKDHHAQFFFKEANRILKKKGILRLQCPDIDLHYSAFIRNDLDFFYWRDWYKDEKDYKRIMLNIPLNQASIEQLFLQRYATAVSTLHSDGAIERIDDIKLRKLFIDYKYEDALDYCCNKCSIEIQKKYPGNHINWWNRDKIIRMLRIAGFKDIKISGYGQSESPILRNLSLFDSIHPKISLYVETRK